MTFDPNTRTTVSIDESKLFKDPSCGIPVIPFTINPLTQATNSFSATIGGTSSS